MIKFNITILLHYRCLSTGVSSYVNSVYVLGGAIGYFCGLLNTTLNWRWTFRILGIAGLTVVPLSIFILYEPRVIRENRRQRRRGRSSYSILVSFVMYTLYSV